MNNFIMINNNIINLNDVSVIYLNEDNSIVVVYLSGTSTSGFWFDSEEEAERAINDIYDQIKLG